MGLSVRLRLGVTPSELANLAGKAGVIDKFYSPDSPK